MDEKTEQYYKEVEDHFITEIKDFENEIKVRLNGFEFSENEYALLKDKFINFFNDGYQDIFNTGELRFYEGKQNV